MKKWPLQVMLALVLGVLGVITFTGKVKAADCTWTGGGSDSKWSTSGNWANCNGGTPSAASDTALIDLSAAIVTMDVNNLAINSVTINQGTVTVQNGRTQKPVTLNLQGGTLTGAGNISVTNFNWSGGTLSGGGSTTIATALSLSNTLVLTGRTVTVPSGGAATWTSAGAISGTGTLSIGGTFDPFRNGDPGDFWHYIIRRWDIWFFSSDDQYFWNL